MSKKKYQQGVNRYGVDMSYFHNWFERSLSDLKDYMPSELSRELARMSRTADSSVFKEREFTGIDLAKIATGGSGFVRVELVNGEIVYTEISQDELLTPPTKQ